MATRRRALWVGAAALVAGVLACPTAVDRQPVGLSLRIGTRGSCGGVSGKDYDTGCLAAVYVRILDEARQPIETKCEALTDPPSDLGELLRGASVVDFSGLSTNRTVTFEVRGLHSKGFAGTVDELCNNAAEKDYWLFWGESQPIDLHKFEDPDQSRLVDIVVDCRDCAQPCADGQCFGCGAIGVVCPNTFPTSFCVPASQDLCARPCDEAQDCFEGERKCVNQRCDVAEQTGELCAPCTPSGPFCDEGFSCVSRDQGAQVGFCVPSCPDVLCVTGTKCSRDGNGIHRVE